MAQSIQKKLDRTRAPKVQIKYDVETYGAIEKKELPFVMGVMSNLSGDNTPTDAKGKKVKIKNRDFVHIDRDNFNEVLKKTKPKVSMRVPDKLTGEEGKEVNVNIEFQNLEDFHPKNVIERIDPLKKLVEVRKQLASLKQKMDGNDDLEERLNEILKNPEKRDEVMKSLGEVKEG